MKLWDWFLKGNRKGEFEQVKRKQESWLVQDASDAEMLDCCDEVTLRALIARKIVRKLNEFQFVHI